MDVCTNGDDDDDDDPIMYRIAHAIHTTTADGPECLVRDRGDWFESEKL
jgi:hypothetical protein